MSVDQRLGEAGRMPADTRGTSRLSGETVTIGVIFALTVAMILGSRVISPAFGGWNQAETILYLASFLVFCSFGQGLVILVRGLDLSIASVITLGGVLTTTWLAGDNGDLVFILPAILVVCTLVGVASGIGVSLLKVPPFIMTMATGIIVYSLCLGVTRGTPRGYPAPVLNDVMRAELAGLPVPILVLAAFVAGGFLLQSYSTYGRRLYAVGNNPAAAHVVGLPTVRVTIGAYAISALCAGFTGIMLASYANGATLRMGDDYLLPSIAAVVVGGSSILGGKGNFLGTVGGAILLTTLATILSALGIEQGWKTIVEGGVILFALMVLREQVYEALRTWMGSERR
ncbi:MAG: ABC transporter permease [Rhodospirillaceae bacterium]|nr:ABC transporter permease [Rhodospirillaceae bacterium]